MHEMNLHPTPFEMIKSGEKTIELRLNDEKRSLIKVGDRILFTNTESGERLRAEVVRLHKFQSFKELYASLPLLKCGYTEEDIATASPEDMNVYYSKEKQAKYGVLGIELVVIKKSVCRTEFSFKKQISENLIELLTGLLSVILGIVIVCLFPLPIFEEWPELAILLGAVIVFGLMGLGALIIHLIKRKRK